jgi:hypothetical protein
MDPLTKSKMDMMSAWCAIGYLVFIFVGWGLVAGFLFPPTAPSSTPEHIASLFGSDYTRIRIGMVMVMFSALVFIPFVAITAKYIARLEGGAGTLTYIFVLGGVGNMVLSFYPAIWWLGVAFRPDRAPELFVLINDIAWLQLIGGVSMYLAMPIAQTICAFVDKSENPVFPRWSGFAFFWIIVMILPDQLIFFFHEGPFAWNGLFGLWLPVTMFGLYFILTFIVLRKAILRDRAALTV